MDNLVLSNILFRKTRTLLSIAGVALGVILVVLTVGVVHGFMNDQNRRNTAVAAEITFGPPGTTFGFSLSPTLSMPLSRADELRSIEGVAEAVPVGQLVRGRMIDGVDYESFKLVSKVQVIEGRPIASGDEVIIDSYLHTGRGLNVGDEMELLGRPFQIVGVYEPETLGRVKIPLATLQEFLNRPDLCSFLLVKVKDPSEQEQVAARILERFPQHDVRLTRDLPVLYARGTPALQTFLKVVITVSIIISSLVILLAMYTTVTERTRQIGVLKSLGASRGWIAWEIEKEALLISSLGVIAGFILSVAGEYVIEKFSTTNVELEAVWLFYALLVGMVSGAAGALYPALRAANQDPVKALSYE